VFISRKDVESRVRADDELDRARVAVIVRDARRRRCAAEIAGAFAHSAAATSRSFIAAGRRLPRPTFDGARALDRSQSRFLRKG